MRRCTRRTSFSPPAISSRASLLLQSLEAALKQPHSGTILRALVILGLGGAGVYLMLPRGQPAGKRFERYLGGALATQKTDYVGHWLPGGCAPQPYGPRDLAGLNENPEVPLLDHVLSPDLQRWQLAGPNPSADRFGVTS